MIRALILVNLQIDFATGGAVGVSDSSAVIGPLNHAQSRVDFIVGVNDWHPGNHRSFVTSHLNKKIGDVVEVSGVPTVLQPRHCVQHTRGAEPMPGVMLANVQRAIRLGTDPNIPGHSAFYDAHPNKPTGLDAFLRERGVGTVYVAGLGVEQAVKFTAMDSKKLGFETYLIDDACAAFDRQMHDRATAFEELRMAAVSFVRSSML